MNANVNAAIDLSWESWYAPRDRRPRFRVAMSLTRSVAHNTFWQALGRGTSILLALVVFFLVARYLGVEGYGVYTTVVAFLQFFGLAVDLGLYIYLAKTLGEPGVDEKKVVGSVFTLRLVTAIVILGIAPLVVLAFPYPGSIKLGVTVMAMSSLFVTLTQVLTGVFQKSLHMGRFIAAEVIGRVFLVLATVVAMKLHADLAGIFWTVVGASGVTLYLTYIWARRLMPFRLTFNVSQWQSIMRTTWPIALAIAFNVIYFKADTIILSLFKPAHDVGIYGAPYRVFEALISIPAMFAGLLTPILSHAFATDRQRFGRLLQRGFETLLLGAVPLVVGTQFVAREAMEFIAPGFAASGTVLQVLVVGTAAIFLGYLFSNAVVVVNKQRMMMWVYLGVAISSIILYFVAIPRWSYLGAAGVTVFVEALVALASLIVVLRTSGTRLVGGPLVRIVLAGGAMALAMWLGRGLPWFANGVIGVAVYGAAIARLGIVDRATLREIFARSS